MRNYVPSKVNLPLAIEMSEEGKRMKEIANHFGVSYPRIYALFVKAGYSHRNKRRPPNSGRARTKQIHIMLSADEFDRLAFECERTNSSHREILMRGIYEEAGKC